MADAAMKIRAGLARMDELLPIAGPAYPGARVPTFRLATIAAAVIADAMSVDRIPVKGKRRGARKVAAARQYAMALVHLVTGRSQDEVARAFQRNRTTASNHMEMVEWLNDVPEHEAFWEWAERRYKLLVELAELAMACDPKAMWMQAVRGVVREWDDGGLEGAAHDQGKYIALTFWEDRAVG